MEENLVNAVRFQILESFISLQILAVVEALNLKTTKTELRQNFKGYDLIKKNKFREVSKFSIFPYTQCRKL